MRSKKRHVRASLWNADSKTVRKATLLALNDTKQDSLHREPRLSQLQALWTDRCPVARISALFVGLGAVCVQAPRVEDLGFAKG